MSTMTRTRVTNSQVPSYGKSHGPGLPYTNFTTNYVGELKSISDNVNAGFRKIRDSGGVVLSDCAVSRSSREVVPGSAGTVAPAELGWAYTGDMTEWVGGAGLPWQHKPSWLASSDVLLTSLYAKINGSALMSGEALSDLGSTIGMLRRPFRGGAELLQKMWKYKMRHNGKTIRSAATATANAWLEYRYGWKPLMMDCDTIIQKSLQRLEQCSKRRLVVRAGGSGSENLSATFVGKPTYVGANASGNRTYYKSSRIAVGVLYDVTNQTAPEALMGILGTRPRDVPATLWEIVPYSFVVDWFVNVGDWLQAITPVPGITVRGHWATTVTETEETLSASFDGTFVSGTLGKATTKSFSYQRTCNQQLSTHPVWKLNPLSMLHQADAAALMLKPIVAQLTSFRHPSKGHAIQY